MTGDDSRLFGLGPDEQKLLAEQLRTARRTSGRAEPERRRSASVVVPEHYGQIKELPNYKNIRNQLALGKQKNIFSSFFACHETRAKNRTRINGEEFLNFSTYDYLGLNGHPEVNKAAIEALEEFGTSAGASRLVAGERPQHRAFEKALADCYGVEDSVVFVSGHATNVSTLPALLGNNDVVFHDSLAHNSIITGARLSGAARYSYTHNDHKELERLLRENRSKYQRALIVTEGVFSMDGDIANLPELIALKREHTCFLMIDEAHALGVLGPTGRGLAEHFDVDPSDVDIWMGTLSKTLCGCGGYIAGCAELIELLKFTASGFVFSVGMPPPIAAASRKALELMLREPERVARLQAVSRFFLNEARARGLDTGRAQGYAVVPVMAGSSLVAGYLSAALYDRRFNVLPIVHPAVEEGLARLRFFLSAEHREEDMIAVLDAVAEELPKARAKANSPETA